MARWGGKEENDMAYSGLLYLLSFVCRLCSIFSIFRPLPLNIVDMPSYSRRAWRTGGRAGGHGERGHGEDDDEIEQS